MNKRITHKNIVWITGLRVAGICFLLSITSFSGQNKFRSAETGTLKITFINTANGKPVVLRDSLYSNYSGEQYSISKLKYYISNISAANEHAGGYYLMNAASGETSLEIPIKSGSYNSLGFLLGVDSIRNCSGAQTGALDPMNDMFWTWNSGYVMFKLEGTSTASTFDLNRIEHHIGGYKAGNNVATKINFDFASANLLLIKANTTTEVVIETNLDNYWHGSSDISIAAIPVCTTAGELAKRISANFQHLFSIQTTRILP